MSIAKRRNSTIGVATIQPAATNILRHIFLCCFCIINRFLKIYNAKTRWTVPVFVGILMRTESQFSKGSSGVGSKGQHRYASAV